MRLAFAKYHGLGNDFIVVSSPSFVFGRAADVAAPGPGLDATEAAWLCDRHRGIGADGVLIALPPRSPGAAAHMHIYNADGSVPEMCGNGLRCFARWWVESGGAGAGEQRELVVDTDAGPRRCVVHVGPSATAAWDVEVEMGVVRFDRALLGWPGSGVARDFFEVGAQKFDVCGVSVGNPHAVIECTDGDTLGAAQRYGRALSEAPAFAHRTNVEFVTRRPDGDLDVTVYERGCGITEACGTGAVAAVAALGRGSADWVGVHLPGGRLEVRVGPSPEPEAWLRGAAARVYDGSVELVRPRPG